jgi:hypothetical protein
MAHVESELASQPECWRRAVDLVWNGDSGDGDSGDGDSGDGDSGAVAGASWQAGELGQLGVEKAPAGSSGSSGARLEQVASWPTPR